jgi:MOSC domain-containing protein YiiM
MGSVEFPVHFAAAGRTGAYLRVLAEGTVETGDEVTMLERPGHGLTVARVAEIYHGDRSRCEELLRAPEIGAEWRSWANDRLAGESRLLPG